MEAELIKAEETGFAPVLGSDTLIELAERAERQVEAMNKIKKAALKMTNQRDWVSQNGNPYLQVSGAEKVARVFGISWKIEGVPVLEREDDGHFSYTFVGTFSIGGASIETIGTRSSRDAFFKRYSYKGGEKLELPPSEIDKGDVKKAAYTNCIGNGITRLLGIRNLTWDDLEEFAGIKEENCASVSYKKAGKEDKAIQSQDASDAEFIPTNITYKEGKSKDGKGYKLFKVFDGDVEYTTFSESIATRAKDAKEQQKMVSVSFVENNYGRSIQSLTML